MLSRTLGIAPQNFEPREPGRGAGIFLAELLHLPERLDCALILAELKAGVPEDGIRLTFLRTQFRELQRMIARSGKIVIRKFRVRQGGQAAEVLFSRDCGQRSAGGFEREGQIIFIAALADALKIISREGV